MSRFGLWLTASSLSTLGDSVTYFAIGWVATGFGAGAASAVMTVEGIPLVALALVGGVVADRCGIRRTMVACDAAMVLVMAVFALGASVAVPLWSLFVISALSATAAALRRPADGVFPRLFGTGADLPKRMALVGTSTSAARITGPVLGGVLLGVGGLTLTSGLDAATFLLVMGALLMVRPPAESAPQTDSRGPAWQSIRDGVVMAARTPGVPMTLLAIVCLAGAVLPLVSLCLPLAAHQRGWSATQTAAAGAAWTVGGLVVSAVVARRGAPTAPFALAAPLVAIGGVALVGLLAAPAAGFAGMAFVGIGTTLLTSHLMPAFAELAPPDMLARFWALLQLAQMLPSTVVTPLLGAVAAAGGVGAAFALVALLLLGTAAAASRVVRRLPTPAGDATSMA